MAKLGRPFVYQSDEERPETISVRLPRDLYARLQRYARLHRQSLSELVKDGIEWRLEQSADPREFQLEYYDNTVLQELTKPAHLVDDHIPFDEDVAVTLEVPAQATLDISSYDNTVLQESAPRLRGRQSTMRQPIVDLLHEYPEGLSATELKVYLRTEKSLGDTLQGMVRAGILKSVKRGKETKYTIV